MYVTKSLVPRCDTISRTVDTWCWMQIDLCGSHLGGNHRIVLSRSLHLCWVCQVIDLRHVMHMAHVDSLWDGVSIFELTKEILEKLLGPIQTLEAGTRGKTLADQYRLFEEYMLRSFPIEADRKKVRGQTAPGRTTVLFDEFYSKVWGKCVGGSGWLSKVEQEVGQNMKLNRSRITGTIATSIAESKMIRLGSVLAQC